MKKFLVILLCLAMVLSLAACGGNGDNKTPGGNENTPGGNENTPGGNENTPGGNENPGNNDTPAGPNPPAHDGPVKLMVWGAEEDQDLLKTLIDEFKAQYPDFTFDITIGVESEATAKDTVLTDPEAAADVYAFANDQIDALVKAGALMNLSETAAQALPVFSGKNLDDVVAANGEGSIVACTRNNSLYALPFGGGNNYFLFYDSSVISAEQAGSWEAMLDAAQAAGKKVGMVFASGWYNAGFFLGAGFSVALQDDGSTKIDWNGTSAQGVKGTDVVKAMQTIASHPAFMAVPDNGLSNAIAGGNLAAVIDGTWDAGACRDLWGDGYAATKLPTFKAGDKDIQMGCFSGFKLMAVNQYTKEAGWAIALAEYLTNESSQVARFNARQLPPSNKVAAADPAVTENIAAAASAEQDVYGYEQSVGDTYWDPCATFGEQIVQGKMATDDAGIQQVLDDLVATIGTPVA